MAKKAASKTTGAPLRAKVIEIAKLLATPIDFEQLIKDGILASARAPWYEVLDFKLLPAHASQRIVEMKQEQRGDKRRLLLKFGKTNTAAAELYEEITGRPFKAP